MIAKAAAEVTVGITAEMIVAKIGGAVVEADQQGVLMTAATEDRLGGMSAIGLLDEMIATDVTKRTAARPEAGAAAVALSR